MFNFIVINSEVEFHYKSDGYENNEWVWHQLTKDNEVTISKAFHFERSDLKNHPNTDEDFDSYIYTFKLGKIINEYINIPARILSIKNDLLIHRDIALSRKLFLAQRDISIFGRLSNLLEHSNPIVIGGNTPNAIPHQVFNELLIKFPTTTEINNYADARVHTILAQYIDGMSDARGRYEAYFKRKNKYDTSYLDLNTIKKLEVEKYVLIRDLIKDALDNKKNWTEKEWQGLMITFILLLFPKYIMVLENVTIHDYYSNPKKKTNRFIDIALLDANGNLDIIEIKKPFDDKLLRKGNYRNNSIPTAELSGSIMQAEKYLFHLSKWGIKGEEVLTTAYASKLPLDMKIHISNPKAIIIVGRDQINGTEMPPNQLLDFEIIKRKYANMMDIITYDDLLRRLDHTIAALSR